MALSVTRAVLIGQREVVSQVAGAHPRNLRVESKTHTTDRDEMTRRGGVVFYFLTKALYVRVERS